MASSDTLKQLKIKTNSVKRLHKELQYYVSEKDKETQRVEKCKADGGSANDIKQAESVLAESTMMVPETRQRLEAAFGDLQTYLTGCTEEVAGTDELQAAKDVVTAVEAVFQA